MQMIQICYGMVLEFIKSNRKEINGETDYHTIFVTN